MQVIHDVGNEGQAVVRFAEALVKPASQKQRDRFCVAIGAEQVTVRVERHAEWIDLPVRVLLDPRSIEPQSKGVSAVHRYRMAISPGDFRSIVEAVARVEPPVKAASEGVAHTVGIT